MLARIRKSMEEKDQGFTLIELLVVMIIIGILAAIAIPVFLNQRKKAADTATKADISTAGKEIAAYYVDGTSQLHATISGGALLIGTAAAASITTANAVTSVKLSNGSGFVGSATDAITTLTATGCTNANGWYVALQNSGGSQPWYYSASNGLSSSVPTACS